MNHSDSHSDELQSKENCHSYLESDMSGSSNSQDFHGNFDEIGAEKSNENEEIKEQQLLQDLPEVILIVEDNPDEEFD